MSASDFDLNNFYLIDPLKNVCTYSKNNSYFQIEFIQKTAVLNGFRLKRCSPEKMKSYKIICTDGVFKPEEQWTTLIEINEQSENEHQLLDIYEFAKPSPPIRFVRLVQTGPNWGNTQYLKFFHFDLFGSIQ